MKNLIHITLFSLISLVASFQTKLNGQCENTSFYFRTQTDLNNFYRNYSSCTTVYGIIIEGTNIVDLTPLRNITSIRAYLIIRNCPLLSTLNGLGNLTSTETFGLINNDMMTNASSVQNLNVYGTLNIVDNAILQSFVNNTINLINARVELNPKLTRIALPKAKVISNDLTIYNNNSLTRLDELTNLIKVGNVLFIANNFYLFSLMNFSSSLRIANEVIITNNAKLSYCEAAAVCDRIFAGRATISGNGARCTNVSKVATYCFSRTRDDVSEINIYPNPVRDMINIEGLQYAQVSVYSTDGVMMREFNNVNGILRIETSNWNPGIYIIKISDNDATLAKQIAVQ